MSIRLSRLLATAFILFCFVSSTSAVTVQDPGDVLPDGSAFLFVEAEDVSEIGGADPSLAWVKVDKNNPIQTINEPTTVKGGLDVLPADTNASGGAALLDQLGGGGTATWELQFAIPATYLFAGSAAGETTDFPGAVLAVVDPAACASGDIGVCRATFTGMALAIVPARLRRTDSSPSTISSSVRLESSSNSIIFFIFLISTLNLLLRRLTPGNAVRHSPTR